MRARRGLAARAACLATALLLGASACGGATEEETVEDVQGLADEVMATGADVVETLEGAGLEVASAVGRGETCQMEPAPGLTFGLGGQLTEEAAYAEQHAVALEALEADGWEVTDAGEYPGGDEEGLPYARLSRDTFRLSLDRTVREGSDALVFGVQREDDCIRVPDGSVRLPEDLEEISLVEGPSG